MARFREAVYRRFLDRLAAQDPVDLDREIDAVTAEIRRRPELLAAFVEEELRKRVASIANSVYGAASRQRQADTPAPSPLPERDAPSMTATPTPRQEPAKPARPIPTGGTVQTVAQLRAEVERESMQDVTWMVPSPEPVRLTGLLGMRLGEVMALARSYGESAVGSAITSRWLNKIAAGMNDWDTVGSVFSHRGLTQLREDAEREQLGPSRRSIAS